MVLLRLSHKDTTVSALLSLREMGGKPASVFRTLRQSYEEDRITRNKDLQTNSM